MKVSSTAGRNQALCNRYWYNEGLSAAAAAEKIHAVYEEEAISDRVARKEGNFDLSDSVRSGWPSDLDEEKLNALVHEDPRQSTRELAEKIGCGHMTVSRHLLSMGKAQEMGSWVPHQLSRDDKARFAAGSVLA
ncbi:hypothetical protein M514_21459 [Trichuris suis]|uniref:Mos1 transposase HTH domain-containing protein n=1 Tax=Trichuris suis TaxID=68888 RepID=A0A085NAD3_9BILA|nr:hypothetical protein M514_21459 [Trichuris suis]